METIGYSSHHAHHQPINGVPGFCASSAGFAADLMNATTVKKMCKEDERLRSLHKWTAKDIIDIVKAAKSGFFYFGVEDVVQCQFCQVKLDKWKRGDDIEAAHRLKSPECPLLLNKAVENIKSDPSTYDVCGIYDKARFGVTHPQYELETSRLDSFTDWPISMKQTPAMLAEAGFYYTGTGDQTICFSCGGGLQDWDDEDVPWEQHAMWMPNCPYLFSCKGEQYIQRFSNGQASQ